MPSSRQPYVKPEVLQFEYEVDPRVTLAANCKDFQSGVGAAAAGCRTQFGGACRDVSGS